MRLSSMDYYFSVDHMGELPYQCKICDVKFNRSDKLQKHTQQLHLDVKFYCDICGKEFQDVISKRDHLKKAHKGMTERKLKAMLKQKEWKNM